MADFDPFKGKGIGDAEGAELYGALVEVMEERGADRIFEILGMADDEDLRKLPPVIGRIRGRLKDQKKTDIDGPEALLLQVYLGVVWNTVAQPSEEPPLPPPAKPAAAVVSPRVVREPLDVEAVPLGSASAVTVTARPIRSSGSVEEGSGSAAASVARPAPAAPPARSVSTLDVDVLVEAAFAASSDRPVVDVEETGHASDKPERPAGRTMTAAAFAALDRKGDGHGHDAHGHASKADAKPVPVGKYALIAVGSFAACMMICGGFLGFLAFLAN